MKSKIWRIRTSADSAFARLLRHYHAPIRISCSECGHFANPQHQPLIVEWEDNSNQIGDFVFAGADIVLRDRVAQQLRQVSNSFRTLEITFFDHPRLRKPERCSKRRLNSRVWLPNEGPALSQLITLQNVALESGSSVVVDCICNSCGRIQYKKILGVEEKTLATSKPRVDGKGLFVSSFDLGDADLFSPIGLNLVLCTNKVKDFFDTMNFSNVNLLEYGNVV